MTWRTKLATGIGAAVSLMAVGACGTPNSQATGSGSGSAALAIGNENGGSASDAKAPQGPPPQAALDACANLSQGDACSFTDRGHDLAGTCDAPEGKPLACRPAGGPDGQGPQGQQRPPRPPQAAIDACQNLSSGASCSFTLEGQTLTGTCRAPQGKPLACMPDHMPPRPQG